MKPTERQLNDPAWWAREMPDQAEALIQFKDSNCVWVDSEDYEGKPAWRDIREGGHYRKDRHDFRALTRPQEPTPWKGPQDGWPPVGTPVTVVNPDCYSIEYGQHLVDTGEPVTVAANYTSSDNVECTVVEHDGGGYVFRSSMLRPIQSERDKAVAEMSSVLSMINLAESTPNGIACRLHELGYRKPMSREKAIYAIQRLVPDLDTAQVMAIADMLGYGESQ